MKITTLCLMLITVAILIGITINSALNAEAKALQYTPASCTSNANCTSNEFCEFTQGQCGGTGRCTPIPTGCSTIYAPVCGCNSITYSNDCFRMVAKTSFQYNGLC